MDKKEIFAILLAVILMTLLLSFYNAAFFEEKLISNLIVSALIILLPILMKNIVARIIDVKITHKTWELTRYWYSTGSYLKKPIPMGILFPLLISFVSMGYWRFLVFLQYSTVALPAKVVKKYGRSASRFSEVNEWDEAMISFYGILAVFLLAVAAKIASAYDSSLIFSLKDIAKYSFYYGIFSMIPFGKLDGMRLLLGSRPLYVFSLILLLVTGFIVIF